MTDETEIEVQVTPLVQVVLPNEPPRTFAFSELALDNDDPATIADDALIARVARWMDRDEEDFRRMVVTRPQTGNILIAPKAEFGSYKEETIYAMMHQTDEPVEISECVAFANAGAKWCKPVVKTTPIHNIGFAWHKEDKYNYGVLTIHRDESESHQNNNRTYYTRPDNPVRTRRMIRMLSAWMRRAHGIDFFAIVDPYTDKAEKRRIMIRS